MSSRAWIEDVNRFWFDELGPSDWFAVAREVDDEIRRRFARVREALKADPPELASLDAAGHLATVILFDQFSRNLFRESAEAYATDALALGVAIDAIARKLDGAIGIHQRHFLYMPFMHSEDRGLQAQSVALFRTLGQADLIPFALDHQAVVDRFGRFPHRNAVLGRRSTDEEEAFLRAGSQAPRSDAARTGGPADSTPSGL